jgi:integrase
MRDLFETAPPDTPSTTSSHVLFKTAFAAWLERQNADRAVRRATSRSIYANIWGAFSAWCVSQQLELQQLRPSDLNRYIEHRAGLLKLRRATRTTEASFSPRYAWRLLTLIDHVLQHHAAAHQLTPNTCAQLLLSTKEEWRFANTPPFDNLPVYLEFDQSEALICWLQAHMPACPSKTDAPGSESEPHTTTSTDRQTWVQARNRTSVALQLGSGLTPGEVRNLQLDDVLACPTTGVPLKLHLRALGTSTAHQVPLAPWSVPLLQNWLDVRQACRITATVLFPGARGTTAWSKVSQFEAAQATLIEAGIPEHTLRGGSFMLRHTFALRQVHAGIDIQRLASWLGIVDLKRLRPYGQISYGPQRPV